MDNIKTTIMTFPVSNDTNTSHVTTTSNHSNAASVESNEICNLASLKINLDSIVDLDERVWVTDSV